MPADDMVSVFTLFQVRSDHLTFSAIQKHISSNKKIDRFVIIRASINFEYRGYSADTYPPEESQPSLAHP